MTRTTPEVPALPDRIARIIQIHFDPDGGTPYWLERQRTLGIDARREIRTTDDLLRFGPMDESALARHPIEHFVPRMMPGHRSEFVIGETAGTLGAPKFAVHRADEFHMAFVEPFLAAASRVHFPRELNWLFIGPTGPHIIGKAARACANAMGSPDPFTIDLDPRWAKKLPPGSFALKRYVEHIEQQAMNVLNTQEIGVLFSTPVVLDGLAAKLSESQRSRIRGVHLGGLAVSPEQRSNFQRNFANAVILSGYGNTLFGMMPELAYSKQTGFDYFPHGLRLIVRTIACDDGAGPNLCRDAAPGQRGRVVVTRLSETQLILNLMERDTAIRLSPPNELAKCGFLLDGLRDPAPIVNAVIKPAVGLY